MANFILDDAREYVFPLMSVVADTEKNAVYLKDHIFLGTAFFVTRKGDAVASGHTIHSPEELPSGRRLVAIVVIEGKEQVCWVNYAARFDALDLALLKINLQKTRYLETSFDVVLNGEDVTLIGIPTHSISGSGKEMRTLKGHVTLSGARLELSVPIPAGMSGSPVFVGTKVVAYATGVVRSEDLEELIEEETIERSSGERLKKRTEVKRVIHYGIARPFSVLKDMRHEVLENRTLDEFIAQQNRESEP